MHRRDFAKLSALTLAATRLPSLQAQLPLPTTRPIGFAAVGLGIISGIFSQALAQSTQAKLTAVVTGHPSEKGEAYRKLYNLPGSAVYTYDTYNTLRENPAVDAVYIGLPNSMHCDFTVRAAEAGKHVLCEKPMAISSAECRRMIDACRSANVHLMIAYRLWYDPLVERARSLVQSGAIGKLQSFAGAFLGQQPTGAWRLNRALAGGGSVFDLGIYPLNTIRYITGETPSAYTAVVSTREPGPRFAQVEQSIEWTMKYPSGIIASCRSSYGASGESRLEINGDRGWLLISPAYGYDGLRLTGQLTNHTSVDEPSPGKIPYQFVLEADHLANCIRNHKTPKTPGELGLADLESIEAIYKAAGTPVA
jgi:predicted dehydrogenase